MATLTDVMRKHIRTDNLFTPTQYSFTTIDTQNNDETHHFTVPALQLAYLKPEYLTRATSKSPKPAAYHGLTASGRISMSESRPLVATWNGPRYHIFPSTHADLDSLGTLVNLLTSSDTTATQHAKLLDSLRDAYGQTPKQTRYHYEITGCDHGPAPYAHASTGPLRAPLQLTPKTIDIMLAKLSAMGGILYLDGKQANDGVEENNPIEYSEDTTGNPNQPPTIPDHAHPLSSTHKRILTATAGLHWSARHPSPKSRPT